MERVAMHHLRSKAAVLALLGALLSLRTATVQTQPLPDETAPFFDDTVVHEVKLWINSKDWTTLKENFLSNAYYPADLGWNDQVVRNVGIRSRGNGSRSGFKPGLRVDIDRYSTTQKFLGLKSFVLRNNIQDPSQIREWLSMLFFRRMGMPAPREAYARLTVNNEYAGLYTIVESVDRSFLQRNFGEDTGYLYDYDYAVEDPPYYFEYRGADPGSYVPRPFQPATHESDARPEVIEAMIRTVNTASSALFRTEVAEFLDLEQLVRYVATEAYLVEQDGFLGNWGMNNFYLYRPAATHQFRLIVWDKSQAFLEGPTISIWRNITNTPEAQRNRLMSRALEYPDLRARYLDTLVEAGVSASQVSPSDPRGWMEREVERAYALIGSWVQTDPLKGFTNEEFESAVAALRAFARDRPAFVNLEVSAARTQP